jgi:hypothetical protein
MNNKLKSFAILPVAGALMFFGLQAVTASFAATSAGSDPTSATTGAEAATIEDCDWYLTGVESSISLAHDGEMEYIGDDYTLEAENPNINVYFSGTETEDERCSFYDDVLGAHVAVTWNGIALVASGGDGSLNWNFGDSLESGGVSSLDITYTANTCDAAFDAGVAVSITDIAATPQVPASISNASTGGFDPSDLISPSFAKCGLDASYSIVMPGGRTPDSPGSSYTFAGPEIDTTIIVGEATP